MIKNHRANDSYFEIGLGLTTPSGEEPPWRYDGVTYPGFPAAGNCDGDRVDDLVTRHSTTRYLTASAFSASLGPQWRPTGDVSSLLSGVFERAEAAGVGLDCADGRR